MRIDKLDTRPGPAEPAALPQPMEARRPKKLWRILGGCASATLFIVACTVLYHIVRDIDVNELRASFANLGSEQIMLACLFTALSYFMLTGYDALALRQIGSRGIGYPTTALASFTSYAVSFTLGFPLLTAGAVRLWVYGAKGLSAPKIASLTLIAGITFWLGMGLVLGFSLLTRPDAIADINHLTPKINLAIGAAIIAATAAYFIFIAVKPRRLVIQGWKLSLPSWRVTIGQVILGVADVCAGGGILFVLLPTDPATSFGTFIAAYVFAHILGLASHAPAGAGVFETTMLLSLSHIPPGRLLGAILLYRLFYYLVPFVLALLLLGLHEIQKRLQTYKTSSHDEEDESPAGQ